MDRYYVDSCGGRGWPMCHVVVDRSTIPHKTVSLSEGYKLKSKPSAAKVCARLNAEVGPFWNVTPNERDSLTRLRDWAASTAAFTQHPYDPNAAPALVRAA